VVPTNDRLWIRELGVPPAGGPAGSPLAKAEIRHWRSRRPGAPPASASTGGSAFVWLDDPGGLDSDHRVRTSSPDGIYADERRAQMAASTRQTYRGFRYGTGRAIAILDDYDSVLQLPSSEDEPSVQAWLSRGALQGVAKHAHGAIAS
jgi:hypothetical protein